MKNRILWLILGLLALLLLSLLCLAFIIPRIPIFPVTKTYIYSVKYVCVPEVAEATPQLSPSIPIAGASDYKTVVNIRNFLEKEVSFQQRIIAPNGPLSAITDQVQEVLGPNDILEIDCQDIASILQGVSTSSPTGFVAIESPVELEVVAVYTTVFHDREKDDQTTDETTTDRDEQTNNESADKYVALIKLLCPPTDEIELEALAEIGIETVANEIEVILPTSIGMALRPQEGIKTGLTEALTKKLIEKGIDPTQAEQRAKTLIDEEVKIVKILDVEFGLGKGYGLGLGVGRGIGRGIGIGIGAGSSIDVEYIEPKIVRNWYSY